MTAVVVANEDDFLGFVTENDAAMNLHAAVVEDQH